MISNFQDTAVGLFSTLGFRKRRGDIFTLNLTNEVIGWIGLNKATRNAGTIIEINPVIGVRHQPTEKLIAEIKNEKFHPYTPPTISVHLGYLTPEREYKPWLFKENIDPLDNLEKLIEEIKEYGFPFMSSNVNLENLINTMENQGLGIPDQTVYRLPAIYHLLGKNIRAKDYIRQELEKQNTREDLAAQAYRKFATILIKYLGLSEI